MLVGVATYGCGQQTDGLKLWGTGPPAQLATINSLFPVQVTDAASNFCVRTQGSPPNAFNVAGTAHVWSPTHAAVTVATDDALLHVAFTEYPVVQLPIGVPKDANATPVMVAPFGAQLRDKY